MLAEKHPQREKRQLVKLSITYTFESGCTSSTLGYTASLYLYSTRISQNILYVSVGLLRPDFVTVFSSTKQRW